MKFQRGSVCATDFLCMNVCMYIRVCIHRSPFRGSCRPSDLLPLLLPNLFSLLSAPPLSCPCVHRSFRPAFAHREKRSTAGRNFSRGWGSSSSSGEGQVYLPVYIHTVEYYRIHLCTYRYRRNSWRRKEERWRRWRSGFAQEECCWRQVIRFSGSLTRPKPLTVNQPLEDSRENGEREKRRGREVHEGENSQSKSQTGTRRFLELVFSRSAPRPGVKLCNRQRLNFFTLLFIPPSLSLALSLFPWLESTRNFQYLSVSINIFLRATTILRVTYYRGQKKICHTSTLTLKPPTQHQFDVIIFRRVFTAFFIPLCSSHLLGTPFLCIESISDNSEK